MLFYKTDVHVDCKKTNIRRWDIYIASKRSASNGDELYTSQRATRSRKPSGRDVWRTALPVLCVVPACHAYVCVTRPCDGRLLYRRRVLAPEDLLRLHAPRSTRQRLAVASRRCGGGAAVGMRGRFT